MKLEDNTNLFLSLASSWSESLDYEILSWLAVKIDERWVLHRASRLFGFQDLSVSEFEIQTATVWAGRKKLQLDTEEGYKRISAFLSSPGAMKILENDEAKLTFDSGKRVRTYLQPDGPAGDQAPRRLPTLKVSGESGVILSHVERRYIDYELMVSDEPFDGVNDLLDALGILQTAPLDGESQTVELALVPPVRFSHPVSLFSGVFEICMEAAPGINLEDCAIGIRTIQSIGGVNRLSFNDLGKLVKADPTVKNRWLVRLEVGDVLAIQAFLSYRDIPCEKFFIRDATKFANLRYAIHNIFDQNSEVATALFSGKGDELENSLSLILNVLGLQVLTYGVLSGLREGPDILAISDTSDLYVIECSAGSIDNKGKLDRLYERTREIRDRIGELDIPVRNIQAVAVTNLLSETTRPFRQKAASFKIAIVSRENLEELSKNLDRRPGGDEILQSLTTLIPLLEQPQES